MHDKWILGANDPDLMGWVTTIAYLAVAVLCYAAAGHGARVDKHGKRRRPLFWYSVTGILLALGVNKELDLQTPFIHAARCLAVADGWYGLRNAAKWGLVVVLTGTGLALLLRVAWYLRRDWTIFGPACLGIGLLLMYVAVRASPLQHVNPVTGCGLPADKGTRHILELGAIACVGVAATAQCWTRMRKAKVQS